MVGLLRRWRPDEWAVTADRRRVSAVGTVGTVGMAVAAVLLGAAGVLLLWPQVVEGTAVERMAVEAMAVDATAAEGRPAGAVAVAVQQVTTASTPRVGDSTVVATTAWPQAPPLAVPPTPEDAWAGPVPDDEMAIAFAAAVPPAPGVDPIQQAGLSQAAVDEVHEWYAAAGWADVAAQGVVVTSAGAERATAVVLWSGEHPTIGRLDRRIATVTLTGTGPPWGDWTSTSIEGGPGDG